MSNLEWCSAYLVFLLLFVIVISLLVIVVFVILVLKLILIEVVKALLELQCFTSEPVDGTWDKLFLDILAKLVVKLKLRLDVIVDFLLIILIWRRCWVEEVEE